METSADRPALEPTLEVMLVDLGRVLPTEEVNREFVDTLAAGIGAAGVWTHPLLIESDSLAVLDGHHRLAAAKQIGLRSVPALCVSYRDPRLHLESWRPGPALAPAEIIARARARRLLPYKSTRHITDFVIPQVRVPIQTLRNADAHGSQVAIAGRHPPRSMMLVPDYNRLCFRLHIRPDAASCLEIETSETQAPHIQLRRSLQADPSMAALLPVVSGRLVLGSTQDSPFLLRRTGLLHLPPTLLSSPAALAIAARWGLEAAYLQASGLLSLELLPGIILHGKSLLRAASIDCRDALLDGLPERIAAELMDFDSGAPSDALLGWQRTRLESLAEVSLTPAGPDATEVELWHCVEELLVSGGDTRIAIDRRTGFNRYGTVPRPRPEAVHFSSSTASSISEYGFTYCDVLRRDLLAALLREGLTPAELRARAVDAVGLELLDLLALADEEADVVMAASGTETELLAVLLGLASGNAVTNILIAPDETGRGVREAGAGLYFDSVAASGAPIRKGEPVWPRETIRTVEIPIRDNSGVPRANAAVAEHIGREIEQALARHERVLLHMLASSKTGLLSPSPEAVDELTRAHTADIDVVVDACQMRSPFRQMGSWVRRGWMVQVSGSKFLTGPPFSGALMLPKSLRSRSARAAALLREAPGVGSAQDWNSWWRRQFGIPATAGAASFGAIFRWLPALLEARLLSAIPARIQQHSFSRFRAAMNEKLDASEWLVRMPETNESDRNEPGEPNLATRSIICFAIMAPHWDGTKHAMDEEECRRIFQLLNLDLNGRLGELGAADRARAGFQAHIGQPVVISSSSRSERTAMLRMVLGARFFSIVAHAGPGSVEAALESEIGDAIRALEKLELLARMWRTARHIPI